MCNVALLTLKINHIENTISRFNVNQYLLKMLYLRCYREGKPIKPSDGSVGAFTVKRKRKFSLSKNSVGTAGKVELIGTPLLSPYYL